MTTTHDLICFSHLRWGFVYQRPNHLMERFARDGRVFFVEEPEPLGDGESGGGAPRLEFARRGAGLHVVTPRLPRALTGGAAIAATGRLVDELIATHAVGPYALWYYTPMALALSEHLRPRAIVYDCMDELSAFAGAPPELRSFEARLLARADLVFTGGMSIYEAKQGLHPRVHAFPSSVDAAHFARARVPALEPHDQALLPRPRAGFFGVIDERLDRALLAAVADLLPHWQFVMIGPVVKIDPASLPQRPNVHYLGGRPYGELPDYIAGWDVALMPFALNEATRFISPTKTLEYLAAGKPVVSTPVPDVVRPYGEQGLVAIAGSAPAFAAAIERAAVDDPARRVRAEAALAATSWDATWQRMRALLDHQLRVNAERPARPSQNSSAACVAREAVDARRADV